MSGDLDRVPPKVILYGGTGQARVVRPIIEHAGAKVVAVFDDTPGLRSPFEDVPIYRGYQALLKWIGSRNRREIGFCVAIGNPHGRFRLQLHDRLMKEGLSPVTLIHPAAWIASNVSIGSGSQISAGAVIPAEAEIGRQCIINTNASVDHDCILGEGSEIAPGATLCGQVQLGVNAWVCAGATVLPNVKIGADAIVGAGAVVTRDVPDGVMIVGVPAKRILKEAFSV